jgi:hypothetical protein
VASAASSLGGFNKAFPSTKTPIGRFAASAADESCFDSKGYIDRSRTMCFKAFAIRHP